MAKPDLDLTDRQRNNAIALRQVREAIDETTAQRVALIQADGDLAEIRRLKKRLDDLQADAAVYEQKRELLELEADKAESARRLREAEAAIATLRAPLEEIIAEQVELEADVDRACARKLLINAKYEAYKAAYPKILPRFEWFRDFTLQGLDWHLTEGMKSAAHEGFHKLSRYIGSWDSSTGDYRKPSVALRESLAAFLDNLRSSVREREDERAAKNSKENAA
jgi:hypothetical protein